jgi:hypothetical protein
MKIKITGLFLTFGSLLFGQSNVFFGEKDIIYPQKPGLYITEQDFINDSVKYVGEFEKDRSEKAKKVHLNVIDFSSSVNFGDTYYKFKDATFFGYKDDYGNRYRVVNGGSYPVRAFGTKWVYSVRYLNQIDPLDKKKTKIIKAGQSDRIYILYSNGLSNELIPIKSWDKDASKEANEKLFGDDAEISQQYLMDKKKDYHTDNKYVNALERIIYYTDLYNKKHPNSK